MLLAAQRAPRGHGSQLFGDGSSSARGRKYPSAHTPHTAAPPTECVPAAHGSQLAEASTGAKRPGAHGAHASDGGRVEVVPLAHSDWQMHYVVVDLKTEHVGHSIRPYLYLGSHRNPNPNPNP